MLKSLDIKNLTVFAEANLEFSPQLNVIVGENAVGKSHLLKVPYAVLATSAEEGRKPNARSADEGGSPDQARRQAGGRPSARVPRAARPQEDGGDPM